MTIKSSPIRIVYVIPTFSAGGAEMQQLNIIRALNVTDFDWHLVIFKGSADLINHVPEGLRSRISVFGYDHPLDVISLVRIIRLILGRRPEILHTHMFSANLFGRFIKVLRPSLKLINHYHGLSNWMQGLSLLVERSTNSLVDRCLVVSEASKSVRVNRDGVGEDKVEKILNSIDPARISDGLVDAQGSKRVVGSAFRLGTASRLIPLKQIELQIDLVKRLLSDGVRVELHIAGDGNHRDILKAYAGSLDLSRYVQFHGHVEHVGLFLAGLDCFCITSETEDSPLSIIEAMAVGLPVLAHDVGGVRELVDGVEQACVVESVSSQYEEVKAFLERQKNLPLSAKQELSERTIKNFGAPRYLARLSKIYREVVRADS